MTRIIPSVKMSDLVSITNTNFYVLIPLHTVSRSFWDSKPWHILRLSTSWLNQRKHEHFWGVYWGPSALTSSVPVYWIMAPLVTKTILSKWPKLWSNNRSLRAPRGYDSINWATIMSLQWTSFPLPRTINQIDIWISIFRFDKTLLMQEFPSQVSYLLTSKDSKLFLLSPSKWKMRPPSKLCVFLL